eukprot:750856-Hanusia_phi.AAC.1
MQSGRNTAEEKLTLGVHVRARGGEERRSRVGVSATGKGSDWLERGGSQSCGFACNFGWSGLPHWRPSSPPAHPSVADTGADANELHRGTRRRRRISIWTRTGRVIAENLLFAPCST